MIINKIDKIEIQQKRDFLDQTYGATINIFKPEAISLEMDEFFIAGGIGNQTINTLSVTLADLFQPYTTIYVYGWFYDKEYQQERYGYYNLLTKEIKYLEEVKNEYT